MCVAGIRELAFPNKFLSKTHILVYGSRCSMVKFFSDVVSSLVFEQCQISQSDEDGMVGSSTLSCRQQILGCYHLKERCEEVEILGNEMKNAVKFYVNDIRNLQSVKEDDYSMGDDCLYEKGNRTT